MQNKRLPCADFLKQLQWSALQYMYTESNMFIQPQSRRWCVFSGSSCPPLCHTHTSTYEGIKKDFDSSGMSSIPLPLWLLITTRSAQMHRSLWVLSPLSSIPPYLTPLPPLSLPLSPLFLSLTHTHTLTHTLHTVNGPLCALEDLTWVLSVANNFSPSASLWNSAAEKPASY